MFVHVGMDVAHHHRDGFPARFGTLHPELAMGGWAAERPSATVQVDDHRMWTGTLGHRYVGTQARAQLDVFFETANCRKVLVVNGRQLFPSAALRNNIAGWIPDRQLTENLTVVFADHRSYLPAFRKTLAHLPSCEGHRRRAPGDGGYR